MSSKNNHQKKQNNNDQFTSEDIIRESGIKMIAKYPTLLETTRLKLSEYESYESLRDEKVSNFQDSHFKFT